MAHPVRDFLPRRRLVLAGGAAALAGLGSGPGPAAARPEPISELPARLVTGTMKRFVRTVPARPMPDLEFLDANDKPVRLTDTTGKVRLLNLWATWCAPCVKEMPSLDRLQGELPKSRFLVLPISLDGPSKPKVAPFYREQKLGHLGIFYDLSLIHI